MGIIDSVARIAVSAFAAAALAACGGSDPSVGHQDITFAIQMDEHAPVPQGGSSAADARVVDRFAFPPEEVPPDADEQQPFEAAVSLRMVGPLPPGVSAEFAPSTIRPGETASMVVSATAAAQPGRHQLVAAGTLAGGSTTTEYKTHEVSVTGTCAAGTEVVSELFPSRMARTIGLTRSGTVYLWGRNTVPEVLGFGSTNPVPRALEFYSAQRIDELPPAMSAASANGVSAIVLKDGTLRVLGIHYRSQVGAPFDHTGWQVQQVPDLSGFVQIVAQGDEFFALHGGGTIWRFNSSFDHTNGLRVGPATGVTGVLDATSLAAGRHHLLVLRRDGSVLAMGSNDHGQLGTGDTQPVPTLQAIAGLTDITRIAAGDEHSLAIRTDTTALAWGRGDSGQIGNGRRADALRPVQIESANRNPFVFVIDIAAGSGHSLLELSDGSVMAWGRGAEGQLGHGALEALNPMSVSGPFSARVFAAGNHSLVITHGDGTVRGWGDNTSGQLGDGTALQRAAPVDALGLGHPEQTCGGGGASATL